MRGSTLLLLAGGVALAAAGASSSSPSSTGPMRGSKKGRATLEALLQRLPLDDTQRGFLLLTAYGESGFSSTALNDTPSEARAAGIAYDRHAEHYASCGFPRSAWTYGSGGWFQILPPNGLWGLRNTPYGCWNPSTYPFDPAQSITAAVQFARGLQGWSRFKLNPTVVNLRYGWGNPSGMGLSITPAKMEKFSRHAAELGFPSSFLSRPIARFPGNPVAIYQALTSGGAAAA